MERELDQAVSLDRFKREVAARRRRKTAGTVAIFGLLILAVLVSFLVSDEIAGYALWAAIIGSGIGVGTGKLKTALHAAVAIRDKRAIGPLIDLLDDPEETLAREAELHLKFSLPGVQEGDRFLSRAQIERLGRLMSETLDSELALRCMQAVNRFRDPAAIPALERVALKDVAVSGSVRERMEGMAHMALADIRISRAKELIAQEEAPPTFRVGDGS